MTLYLDLCQIQWSELGRRTLMIPSGETAWSLAVDIESQ